MKILYLNYWQSVEDEIIALDCSRNTIDKKRVTLRTTKKNIYKGLDKRVDQMNGFDAHGPAFRLGEFLACLGRMGSADELEQTQVLTVLLKISSKKVTEL
ncbi:hypothetical protein RUM43_001599 [Polyplax serrata]|uniref:Uncharacterized protein n=1 Tax=Polyplax serrata TaxID=468196 RepID=A0AAN8XQ15_POLSC